jgi:hypothetical protein
MQVTSASVAQSQAEGGHEIHYVFSVQSARSGLIEHVSDMSSPNEFCKTKCTLLQLSAQYSVNRV